MKCEHCHDTGSRSKSEAGYLDCIHCGVAAERTELEAWARRFAPSASLLDLWAIYLRGKAAGAELIANNTPA